MKRMFDWKDIGIVIDFYLFFIIFNKIEKLRGWNVLKVL